jgi:hypothetical protein
LTPEETFIGELQRLEKLMHELMETHVVESILKPLQSCIAIREAS